MVDQNSLGERLNILFFIFALSASVIVIVVIRGNSYLENIDKLNSGNIAVAVSSWDISIFLSLPCFVALIIALCFRLANQVSERRIGMSIKIALIFAIIAIVVRIPYGYIASHYMRDKGYSPCWEFSSPSIMGDIVWVRNFDYCIENSGSVRKELLAWIDARPNGGKDVSPVEIRTKTEALLNLFDQKKGEPPPNLFE